MVQYKNPTRVGNRAEQLAAQWLETMGLQLIERNARTRFFELDLIMQEGETIVFVEVKYRKNDRYGGGVGAMSADKQRRLSVGALCWLSEQGQWEKPVRFDVVEVLGEGSNLQVIHYPDCFVVETH